MKFVRLFLQSVGALALVLVAALMFFAISKFSGPKKNIDKEDAVFVLNWAGLNPQQQWTIIDASISARSIGGDHADYYCIQLEDASASGQWEPGLEKNELFSSALKQAIEWAKIEGASCFPSYEVANSELGMIRFVHLTTHGREPAGAQILLLQPATKRLFYVSFDT